MSGSSGACIRLPTVPNLILSDDLISGLIHDNVENWGVGTNHPQIRSRPHLKDEAMWQIFNTSTAAKVPAGSRKAGRSYSPVSCVWGLETASPLFRRYNSLPY